MSCSSVHFSLRSPAHFFPCTRASTLTRFSTTFHYIYLILKRSVKKAQTVRALLAHVPSFGRVGDLSRKVFWMCFLFLSFHVFQFLGSSRRGTVVC